MRNTFLKLPRNIYLLSISQVIGMSATTLVFLIGGLIGAEIAPVPSLATLPVTLLVIGLATATIPAVMLMERFKTQGMNDFIIVLSQMFASFFAGSLLFSAGWVNLILLTLPFIVCAFVIFVLQRKQFALSS